MDSARSIAALPTRRVHLPATGRSRRKFTVPELGGPRTASFVCPQLRRAVPPPRGHTRGYPSILRSVVQVARLLARGESQAAVACRLAVTPMTTCRWYHAGRAWETLGPVGAARAARGAAGERRQH